MKMTMFEKRACLVELYRMTGNPPKKWKKSILEGFRVRYGEEIANEIINRFTHGKIHPWKYENLREKAEEYERTHEKEIDEYFIQRHKKEEKGQKVKKFFKKFFKNA